jgi:predicted ATPase
MPAIDPVSQEPAPAPPEGHPLIQTPDQRLRVFVSSTLGELAEERRAVSRAISALRLTPVLFELGARPHPPQELYRAYLAQSDVFIGLYWQRYGQLVPGARMSGLEDEFGLSARLPRLLYVKAPAPDREPRLADLLAQISQQASYRIFRTPAELGRLVRDDLAVLLSERFTARSRAAAPSSRGPRPLPVSTTTLVGREQAIGEVADMLTLPGGRLVTLTGPGGIGKTRLAVAVGERLRDRYAAGVVFMPLAEVTDPRLVLSGISRALGADLMGAGPPLQALAEQLGDDAWLLILDNLEQVVEVARDLGEVLARCPGVAILATSRMVLGLRAEREYPVLPLPLPADPAMASLEDIAASPAVALFVDRARAVRQDFALTPGNAAAVAAICRRLEGLPLAIELAAARIRLLDPAALRDRLCRSLDALGTGAVDLPGRQQTLRATVEWSMGLLPDAERSLLEVAAVFAGGWDVEAAAQVAGLEEGQALDLTEALARHSLIQLDSTGDGPRCRMLETVRAFVAERLAARPDAAEVRRRHAGYYRALAEQAEPHLRGAGQGQWLDRLQAEAANLAAAVDWYLSHDRAPLPHLVRALLPYWLLASDILGQARAWISQLLPAAGSLDPQARAELLWAAAATANQAGDGTAALAASQQLGPLLAQIHDPYLHAVSQLAMSWASTIVPDSDGAIRQASASLQELRSQDEPYWTAAAVVTVGYIEKAAGRYDDAQRHLSEARALAERSGYAWLATFSQLQLGTLAVVRGRLDEARALLDEELAASLAAYSTQNVTLSLAAFAQLAFAEGDPGRAALLAGATEGLRRRAGLGVWPEPQRGEADLATQIRQALGAGRFDQVYAAGARLSRREAVAAARDQRTGTRGVPEAGRRSARCRNHAGRSRV